MSTKNLKSIQTIIFILLLLWCIGIIWELVIHFYPSTFILLPFLRNNYSIVCHTDPQKLLSIGNFTTLTCSRCSGIYFGAFFSSTLVLLGLTKNVSIKTLLLSSLPMLIDVLLYSIGIYTYSHFVALLTGLLLGSVGIIYIHNTIIELLIYNKEKN